MVDLSPTHYARTIGASLGLPQYPFPVGKPKMDGSGIPIPKTRAEGRGDPGYRFLIKANHLLAGIQRVIGTSMTEMAAGSDTYQTVAR